MSKRFYILLFILILFGVGWFWFSKKGVEKMAPRPKEVGELEIKEKDLKILEKTKPEYKINPPEAGFGRENPFQAY